MNTFRDLTNLRFGKVTVVGFSNMDKNNKARFLCRCDCGKEFVVIGASLLSGNTRSCGCLKKEQWLKQRTKHGLSKTTLYPIWGEIIQRTKNKKNRDYKNYGGRGIKVCKEWEENFKSFYEWSIKNGYKKGLSIDRINVNGDYCPENCRWATPKEQGRNTRKNQKISFGGETHCISEWAEILNIKDNILRFRIKRGWTISRALTQPVRLR